MINRRSLIGSLLAAPAIIAANRLMPVSTKAHTPFVIPYGNYTYKGPQWGQITEEGLQQLQAIMNQRIRPDTTHIYLPMGKWELANKFILPAGLKIIGI